MTSTHTYKFRRGEKWQDQDVVDLWLDPGLTVICRDVRSSDPEMDITWYVRQAHVTARLFCEDLVRRSELKQ